MKKLKTIFWISTILYGGLMLFSSIPDIICTADTIKFMTGLGYPIYFIPFIGVAKVLGIIAILIPGFPRIKEWAYAGLFFDLIGAVYSALSVAGFSLEMLGMLIFILPGIFSYIYYHKLLKAKSVNN